MSAYEARWYWCEISEAPHDEPDWSKIPEEKREMVRERWEKANRITARWKLWGPQIPLYQRTPGMEVEVL